jgi:hypothetical protein
LIQGTGEIANINNKYNLNDFGQIINFNNQYDNINFELSNQNSDIDLSLYDKQYIKDIKYASNLFEQCYETPYLPSGNYIKIQFVSYYFEPNEIEDKEFYFGLDNIEIFNEEGKNILNNIEYNYKFVSNREYEKNNNSIFIKGFYDEDENHNKFFEHENYLFYIFDKFVKVSYIKFTPINNDINIFNRNNIYRVKEIKLFCEDKIIFEGVLYNNKPTIILFSSENKFTERINKNYLTNYIKERKIEEIETDNYFSLIIN